MMHPGRQWGILLISCSPKIHKTENSRESGARRSSHQDLIAIARRLIASDISC
jgi:hypothetical protein